LLLGLEVLVEGVVEGVKVVQGSGIGGKLLAL
jgi:hypothetical protein